MIGTALMLITGVFASAMDDSKDFMCNKPEWRAILTAFEIHLDADKQRVEHEAVAAGYPAVRRLAKHLLNKWNISKDEKSFGLAFPIHRAKLDYDKNPAQGCVIPLKIHTNSLGCVENVEFIKDIEDADLKKAVEACVLQSAYRPIFKDGKFRSGETIITFLVEVK
jgi:hypothetical protein